MGPSGRNARRASRGYCTQRRLIDGGEAPTVFRSKGATIMVQCPTAMVNVDAIVAVEVQCGRVSLPLQYPGTSTSCTTERISSLRSQPER